MKKTTINLLSITINLIVTVLLTLCATNAGAQTVYVTNTVTDYVYVTNTVLKPTVSTKNPFYTDALAVGKDIANATNIAVAVYGTEMLSGAKKGAIGGGVVAFYDLNNYVAAGAGLDVMGRLNFFSGNVQLKLPIRPLSGVSLPTWASFASFVTNTVVTPIVVVGIGTAVSGAGTANGGLSSIESAGGDIDFISVKSWDIGAGASYGTRSGAGAYSGNAGNVFLKASRGF